MEIERKKKRKEKRRQKKTKKGTFDCGIIFIDKVTLNQLDGQTRLSDTTTAYDDKFVFSEELENRETSQRGGMDDGGERREID